MSLISGSAIFGDGSQNCSSSPELILGPACFVGDAVNFGTICCGFFANPDAVNCGTVSSGEFSAGSTNCAVVSIAAFLDTSVNIGTIVEAASFSDSSVNGGVVSGSAIFEETASNSGDIQQVAVFVGSATNAGTITSGQFSGSASNVGTIVSYASFADTTINVGIVQGAASFSDTTVNSGTISGSATFSDTSSNTSYVASVVFLGNATNVGIVDNAVFLGTAVNSGVVTASATFSDSASNAPTAVVSGNAIFADTTINYGTIYGDAQIGTGVLSSGSISGSTTIYTQPSGYFANAYYDASGIRIAPPDYETVVHLIQSIWYKYDSSGNASLANGVYNDGSGLYNFNLGIKGSAYIPTGNWYDDLSTQNNTITLNGSVTNFDEGAGIKGVQFDTIESYISTSASGVFAGDFTIEAFVKFSSSIGFESYLIGNVVDININDHNWVIGYRDGQLVMTSMTQVYGFGAWNKFDEWVHIAITRESDTYKAWVNGVLFYSGEGPATDTIGNIYIGKPQADLNSFEGKITSLRIVDGSAVYTSNFAVPNTILTAISGTKLLLNFGATDVPNIWYLELNQNHIIRSGGSIINFDEGDGIKGIEFHNGYLIVDNTNGDYDFGTGDFTVEMFYKSSNTNNNKTFFNTINNNLGWGLLNHQDGANLSFRIVPNPEQTNISSLWQDGNWHHIAYTRSGTTLRGFIDGYLFVTTLDVDDDIQSPGDLGIGTYNNQNGPSSSLSHNERIANIRILKGTALYTASFSVPTSIPTNITNTVLLLNFGATDVPTVIVGDYLPQDESTQNYTITRNGLVYQFNEGGGVKGVQFDGAGGLQTNYPAGFAGDFTIEYFLKTSVASNNNYILGNTSPSEVSTKGWAIGPYGNGLRLKSLTSSTDTSETDSINYEWDHVAMTRYLGVVRGYINGALVYEGDGAFSTFESHGQNLGIGNWNNNTTHFKGKIAGLRIVDGTAIYVNEFIVPTTLPTAVSGTKLLMNFGATEAPITYTPSITYWYGDESSSNHYLIRRGKVRRYLDFAHRDLNVKGAKFNIDILNNYLDIIVNKNNSNDFEFNGDFTIESFVKNSNGANDYSLFVVSNGTNYFALNIENTNANIYLNSNTVTTTKTNVIKANEWNHVALVRNDSSIKLYVNGISTIIDNNNTSTLGYSSPAFAIIGRSGVLGGTATIAGLRVVKGTAVYTSNFNTPTTLPTNITGTKLLMNFGATEAPIKINPYSWYFNLGSVIKEHDSSINLSSSCRFTMETFFNLKIYESSTIFFGKDGRAFQSSVSYNFGAAPSNGKFRLYGTIAQARALGGSWDGSQVQQIIGNTHLQLNTWYHAAFVRKDESLLIYLNGCLDASGQAAVQMIDCGRALALGRNDECYPLAGCQYMAHARLVKGESLYTGTCYNVPNVPYNNSGITGCIGVLALQSNILESGYRLGVGTVCSGIICSPYGSGIDAGASISNNLYSYGFNCTAALRKPHDSNIDLSCGDFTIEAWVKDDQEMFIANKGANYYDYYYQEPSSDVTYGMQTYNSCLLVNIDQGNQGGPASSDGYFSRTFNICDHNWHHVAVVYDNTGLYASTYYDGRLKCTYTFSEPVGDNGKDLFFGVLVPSYSLWSTGSISNYRSIKGQKIYSGQSITVPNAPLTASGYGNVLQNITGEVFLLKNATDLQLIQQTPGTGNVQISRDNPFISPRE